MRDRTSVVPHSLRGLRLRLTAWYVGTLLAVLLLVGLGLFAMVTRRMDRELDASLRAAARAMAAAVSSRGTGGKTTFLSSAERRLILLDDSGAALTEGTVDPWIGELARRAQREDRGQLGYQQEQGRILRAFAEPFRTADGRGFVAIAIGDEIEVEDRYSALIAASAFAALCALMLVGLGGWFIAGKSIGPIERTIEQMRRFMADAAHELRTPITVVRGRAEVALQRERAPLEYRDALRGIELESARMGRLVEGLLVLARADAGERPVERVRVFLDDIVLDTAEAAKAIAARRDIRIGVAEFEEAPITADPGLVRQLVMILLDNAIKFSEPGTRVEIGVAQSGGAAVVRVADQGQGIPADQLPHVFERFYRGDAARSRAGTAASEGAGLGLAIAQWIAEAHGAVIRVDSTVGRGTTVVVRFPLAFVDRVSPS